MKRSRNFLKDKASSREREASFVLFGKFELLTKMFAKRGKAPAFIDGGFKLTGDGAFGRNNVGSGRWKRNELGGPQAFLLKGFSSQCISMKVQLSVWRKLRVWSGLVLMALNMMCREGPCPVRGDVLKLKECICISRCNLTTEQFGIS